LDRVSGEWSEGWWGAWSFVAWSSIACCSNDGRYDRSLWLRLLDRGWRNLVIILLFFMQSLLRRETRKGGRDAGSNGRR